MKIMNGKSIGLLAIIEETNKNAITFEMIEKVYEVT